MKGLPRTNKIFDFLPLYGIIMSVGMLLALFFAYREERRLDLPKDTVLDSALLMIPFGLLGARLYYVLFSWSLFSSSPYKIFYIWEGGLAIWGGLLFGGLALFYISKKKSLSFLLLLDTFLPGVTLAQSLGRWGNYFNMEAYGYQVLNPKWQFFPFAVPIVSPASTLVSWHLATFFYESVLTFGLFLILNYIQKNTLYEGEVLTWYGIIYGTGRALVEGLRTDSLYFLNSRLRVSQILSFIIAIICLLFMLYKYAAYVKLFTKTFLVDMLFSLYAVSRLFLFWIDKSYFLNPYVNSFLYLSYFFIIIAQIFKRLINKKNYAFLLPKALWTISFFLFLILIKGDLQGLLKETGFVFLSLQILPISALSLFLQYKFVKPKEGKYA